MKFAILLFFAFTAFPLIADEEIETIQELIAVTEKNLTTQKKLLTALVQFKHARADFIAEPTSGQLATRLVKSAMQVQRQIEKEHLAYLFPTDFLSEMQFYTRVGNREKVHTAQK